MASTYSDLKIELIGTGDQSGTWGVTTNSNLGNDGLGAAIAGSADVTFASADVTVTLTDSIAAQTARNLRLNLTGTTGGARNLILGSGCQIEKPYLINNGTADTITVKNTTGTGIAVPAGKSMWVYNNGTNVVDAVTHLTSLTLGSALPIASGGTGSTSTTFVNLATNVTGDLPFSNLTQGSALSVLGVTGNATADVASIAAGTDNQVLRRSGTSVAFGAVNLASTDAVTGTLATTNGGTGLTSFTANGVVYASSSSVLATGSALTFDGTNFATTGSINAGNAKFLAFSASAPSSSNFVLYGDTSTTVLNGPSGGVVQFNINNAEQMRLTSTGLGIGTSSPSNKLHVTVSAASTAVSAFYNTDTSNGNGVYIKAGGSNSGKYALAIDNAASSSLLYLDSSGNLGLGVTPSAWSVAKGFEIASPAGITSAGTGMNIGTNTYYNGSNWIYKTTAAATLAVQTNGTHYWSIAPSGTAGNAISFTQAMTLNASGKLLLGDTTSDLSGTTQAMIMGSGGLAVQYTGTTGTYLNIVPGAANGTVDLKFDARSGAYPAATFWTTNTERARITSGGYFKASDNGTYTNSTGSYHEFYQTTNNEALVVRNINASQTAVTLLVQSDRNTTNNSFYAYGYYNGGAAAYKFFVADSGNVTNTNGTYGTISDAKMKTDIVDAGSQWDDIKAIRFRKFKMKDDPQQIVQLGVVAQELEQTSPRLVEEHSDKDAEGNDVGTTTKSVKTSVLLMKAAVALQEAMTRIETLEAKVAQLEGA